MRLLLSASMRRNVENFSYIRNTAFLAQARRTWCQWSIFSRTVWSFPRSFLWRRKPKTFGDLVGGETQQSHVAGAFEELMDGKVALEDEVPAVLRLLDRKQAVQVDRLPF